MHFGQLDMSRDWQGHRSLLCQVLALDWIPYISLLFFIFFTQLFLKCSPRGQRNSAVLGCHLQQKAMDWWVLRCWLGYGPHFQLSWEEEYYKNSIGVFFKSLHTVLFIAAHSWSHLARPLLSLWGSVLFYLWEWQVIVLLYPRHPPNPALLIFCAYHYTNAKSNNRNACFIFMAVF